MIFPVIFLRYSRSGELYPAFIGNPISYSAPPLIGVYTNSGVVSLYRIVLLQSDSFTPSSSLFACTRISCNPYLSSRSNRSHLFSFVSISSPFTSTIYPVAFSTALHSSTSSVSFTFSGVSNRIVAFGRSAPFSQPAIARHAVIAKNKIPKIFAFLFISPPPCPFL